MVKSSSSPCFLWVFPWFPYPALPGPATTRPRSKEPRTCPWRLQPSAPWFLLPDVEPKNKELPSGNLTVCYGKSPCLMGKLTISMAIFNSKLLNYQRVHWLKFEIWDVEELDHWIDWMGFQQMKTFSNIQAMIWIEKSHEKSLSLSSICSNPNYLMVGKL